MSSHTIEYKGWLLHINSDGTSYTYFGEFKTERAGKLAITAYSKLYHSYA